MYIYPVLFRSQVFSCELNSVERYWTCSEHSLILILCSLGLDGDLKKAMKDGKPVIIEVTVSNLYNASLDYEWCTK